MFEGRPDRAAFTLALQEGDEVTVRNRRPGDRIRPLGCRYVKRLKEVLIDRGIPREERDRLPLLCWNDRLVWVPGVTIDETYRIARDQRPWIVSIEPI